MISHSTNRFLASTLVAVATACSALPASATDDYSWTLGHWHGVRRSGADGRATPMTVLVEPLGDGSGQVECLRVESAGAPYVGFTIRRRDAAGAWRMVYVNSTDHTFARLDASPSASASPPAAAASATTWNSVSPARLRESRLVSERIGERGWRKTQQFSNDGGATWEVLFTDELERDPGG